MCLIFTRPTEQSTVAIPPPAAQAAFGKQGERDQHAITHEQFKSALQVE